jgi:hypothetical protein
MTPKAWHSNMRSWNEARQRCSTKNPPPARTYTFDARQPFAENIGDAIAFTGVVAHDVTAFPAGTLIKASIAAAMVARLGSGLRVSRQEDYFVIPEYEPR